MALSGYVWLQLPDRIRQVHRQCLEFWYDPPGCALTDEELELLRRIAAADAPVMFQAEGRTTPAHLAFDHRVDVEDGRPLAGDPRVLSASARLADNSGCSGGLLIRRGRSEHTRT